MKPLSLQGLTISANFAISADGKITSMFHRPSGWTSKDDYQRLLALRLKADALLVGRRTLLADQMSMTVPHAEKQPLRCIASASAHFTGREKIFQTSGGTIHLWSPVPPITIKDQVQHHQGSLIDFLTELHQNHQVKYLHCEGGGALMRQLIDLVGVDEIHLTWAVHTLWGGEQAPTLSGMAGISLDLTTHYELTHFQPLTGLNEIFLSYRLKKPTTQ